MSDPGVMEMTALRQGVGVTTHRQTQDTSALPEASDKLAGLCRKLDEAIALLAAAREFAKPGKLPRVLDTARRVLLQEGGAAEVERRAEAFEEAGVFLGSDWETPQYLVPSLTTHALKSPDPNMVVIEALSELRLLAVARGDYLHPHISAEQAHHYLTQVMAINLWLLFGTPSEAERETQGRLAQIPRHLFQHLAERIGYEHIIDRLIDEIWRILQQRPIQVEPVKAMITQIAICQANPEIDLGAAARGPTAWSARSTARPGPAARIPASRSTGSGSPAWTPPPCKARPPASPGRCTIPAWSPPNTRCCCATCWTTATTCWPRHWASPPPAATACSATESWSRR